MHGRVDSLKVSDWNINFNIQIEPACEALFKYLVNNFIEFRLINTWSIGYTSKRSESPFIRAEKYLDQNIIVYIPQKFPLQNIPKEWMKYQVLTQIELNDKIL